MESHLASKLAELLKEVERREEKLEAKEKAVEAILLNTKDRESAVEIREIKIREESSKLETYRDVEGERKKTLDLMNQLRRDQELLADQRHSYSMERASGDKEMHTMRVELTGFKERLEKREADLVKSEQILREEKIKHHEKMIKDLSELELRKMRA